MHRPGKQRAERLKAVGKRLRVGRSSPHTLPTAVRQQKDMARPHAADKHAGRQRRWRAADRRRAGDTQQQEAEGRPRAP